MTWIAPPLTTVGGAWIAAPLSIDTPVFSNPANVNANNWAVSTLQLQVAPAGASFSLLAPVQGVSLNAGTGLVTFDFQGMAGGNRTFTVRATVNGVYTDQAITVVVNARPVFFNQAVLNVTAGALAPITIEAQDPEGATLTLSAIQMPNGAVFLPAVAPSTTGNGLVYTGTISGNLPGGVHTCVIRAVAAAGGGQTDFTLTINAASVQNQAPVITSSGALSVMQGQTVQRALTATDANGDAVSWTLASAYAWVTLVAGQLNAAPGGAVAAGTYQVVVTASDGALTTNQTVTITVLASPSTGVVPDSTPRERTIFVNRDGSVTYQPFFQDPLATLDYRVDLTKWLAPTDSVANLEFTEDSEMEIVAQASNLSGGTVLLTAGDDRSQYVIVARATTAQGRVHVLRFFVHVIAWTV